MRFLQKAFSTVLISLVVTLSAPWQAFGQEPASELVGTKVVARSDRPPSMNQSSPAKKPQKIFAQTKDKGNPGPLPCDSKNNPKCQPTPSKYQGNLSFDHLLNF